jgi:type III restriction enzyme
LEIHSNKKGEIKEDERKALKNKLFSIDKGKHPKVIISVLMLREGFDVNNICVIVPLRASTSGILLEQTI